MSKYRRRWSCHHNPFLCCQWTDGPGCNSRRDEHWFGRTVFRYEMWRVSRNEAQRERDDYNARR